jgi:hypothetical protein
MWMVPTPKQHFLQWQQSESHSHVAVRGELNLLGPPAPPLPGPHSQGPEVGTAS